MARKGKKHQRSLSSRKRAKDVSSATPVWERFAGDRSLAEPPRSDFETAIPRKARIMQKDMERAKQLEAGQSVNTRHLCREDRPRPEPKGTKQQPEKRGTDTGNGTGGQRKCSMNAPMPDADHFVPPRLAGFPQSSSAPSHAAAASPIDVIAGSKKRRREEMDDGGKLPKRVPKFGETNAAPPALVVGGALAKKVAAARNAVMSAQNKADAIQRQRQTALAAYAAAKARRRAESSTSR